MFDCIFEDFLNSIQEINKIIDSLNKEPNTLNAMKLHDAVDDVYDSVHGGFAATAVVRAFGGLSLTALEAYEKLYKLPHGFDAEAHKALCKKLAERTEKVLSELAEKGEILPF